MICWHRGWLARVQTSQGDQPEFQRLAGSLEEVASKYDIHLTRKIELGDLWKANTHLVIIC